MSEQQDTRRYVLRAETTPMRDHIGYWTGKGACIFPVAKS